MSAHLAWPVGHITLSGRESRPSGEPAGTIVALHGGGYSAAYWDQQTQPDASLFAVGTAVGYRVVAVDRPGYGASAGLTGTQVRAARQAEIILDFVDGLLASGDIGRGVFVIGHSMGAIVALHMAATSRGRSLAGVDISGLPLGLDPALVDRASLERLDYLPNSTVEYRRNLFYGPDGTFDESVLAEDEAISHPVPAAEIIDAVECDLATPGLGRSIEVPIQITRAAFEQSSAGGPEWLNRCKDLFTVSRRVALQWQVASGHNISLHKVAKAYHLRAIAFFEEVRVG